MTFRAQSSGVRLNERDAAIVKGMLKRGDRQHDVAAWFGVNGGRIGEIASGRTFTNVKVAGTENLPPSGPYLSGREAHIAMQALEEVTAALEKAKQLLS